MEYLMYRQGILKEIEVWDSYVRREINLIAAGDTALTLRGMKPSTAGIELIIPVELEYEYLTNNLSKAGFELENNSKWSRGGIIHFFIFKSKRLYGLDLPDSPLEKNNNDFVRQYTNIYLGALNYYDLIVGKLYKDEPGDIDDCIRLLQNKNLGLDINSLMVRCQAIYSSGTGKENIDKNLKMLMRNI